LINDYVLSEDVSAAYAQAEFASERVTFVGGVRYERTEVSSSGYQRAVISGVETYPEINVDSAYEHWLPRATVAYRPGEDVIVRAGYSKSLGRANYRDLRPNRTLSWDGVQTIVSISGGNPALKPRESDNYDLSFERYLDDGLASVAVFHKEIKNEIVSQSVDTEGTYQGREVTFRETAPRTLNESELTGVELNLVLNSLDVLAAPLRGFGIAANYTWITSQSSIAGFSGQPRELLTLPGQPEHTVNGSLFYTIGEFEARIAYNYRSEHLNQTNGREWFDRIWGDRETVDLQGRYTFAGGTSLVAQAKNATGTFAGEENGFGGYFSRRDEGKSFWLGLSYTR
jgi:TonB-dependent receptor